MKKIATILLVLLILASCIVLTSCNFSKPICKDGCEFALDDASGERICINCGNSYCKVNGHGWSSNLGHEEICYICGKTPCQVGIAKHQYKGGVCTACGAGSCKNGEHKFDDTTGVCKYCGKTSCKAGMHQFGVDGQCRWCGKTACQTGGHKYDKGECIHCGKESAFAWVYDIFDKPIESPDQGGQGGNNEWNSKCPSAADGSHGWRDYKCIYCGAVLPDAESRSFWDKVGEGAMLVGFMIAITIGASLIYWLGAAINLSFITWIAHGLMLLMTVGIFLMYHWIWGVVFFVVFGGLYLLACSLITQRYFGHDSNFY